MRSLRLHHVPLAFAAAALVGAAVAADSARGGTIWHATRAIAERDVKERFSNIESVSCEADRASSTLAKGRVRLWNRFECEGRTYDSVAFALVYRATGECKPCWRMSALRGTGAAHLRQRAAVLPKSPPVPPPPPTPPPPATSGRAALASEPFARCAPSYRRAGERMRFRSGLEDGEFLLLKDGTVWQTGPGLRSKTESWNRFHTVVLIDGQFGYPCTMVNLNRGERVPVRLAAPGLCGGATFANAGKRVEYASRRSRGEIVALEDGSEWEVAESQRARTAPWRAGAHKVVVFQGDGPWPHICAMINLDRGEVIDVRRVT